MSHPCTSVSYPTRAMLAAVVLAVLATAAMAPAAALAVVTVSRAEAGAGSLRIEGRALANRQITVDRVAMGTSDGDGRVRLSRSAYSPPADCTVDVNDGSATPATARLTGCTVSSTPPPPPPPAPSITPTTTALPGGSVGQEYAPGTSDIISLSNATGPVAWTVQSGALPAGLSIVVPEAAGRPTPTELTSMEIAGTPTVVGTSTFTLRATDANGVTATRTYSIEIRPATTLDFVSETGSFQLGGEVGFYGFPLEVGTSSTRYFHGSGGVLAYTWEVTAGALPPGMSLIPNASPSQSARLGGTPTTAGTYAFTLQLRDAAGATASHDVSATISDGTLPPPTSLSSLTLSPSTVTGPASSTATVTLGSAAPSQGGFVSLSSSNRAVATVPDSVTVPAGGTTATVTVSALSVTAVSTATISATYGGVTRNATLAVNPSTATAPDTVTVTRAEYDSDKRTMRVEATSNRTGATLRAYVTSSGAQLGTLSGGGGSFSSSSNPQSITVRSSLGGSATRTVTVK